MTTENRKRESFNHMSEPDIFDRLMAQIHERARSMPEGSYTTKLMRGPCRAGDSLHPAQLPRGVPQRGVAGDARFTPARDEDVPRLRGR